MPAQIMTKSFYRENSNCMQGDAEECGNSSSGIAPEDFIINDKVVRRSLFLRKKHLSKQVRKQERLIRKWDRFSCQASVSDAVNVMREYSAKMLAVKSIIVPEKLFFHIEGFISLYFAVAKCVDMSQAIAIASLYCQRYYTKSISTLVVDTLCDLSVQNQSTGSANWLELLKTAKDNWKLVLVNEGFNGVSKVLSIMLSLGLCDSSSINYTIAGMKLFSITATKKQSCAIDLIDAIFETVVFFVEGGYQCFLKGSISPLLSGDFDMKDLEERIAACERNVEFVKTGDLERHTNLSITDFDTELREVIEKLSVVHQTANNDFIKRLMKDKLDKLRKIQTLFMQTRVQGGLREAPFAMSFFGTSGVGKSCVANIMMITTLSFNNFSAKDDRLITINDKDKFMSNYRSNVNGIFFDDVGNTKAEFLETAPTSRVIELVNNVRAYATMADIEMKGKVSIEPKVVCFTSNVKTLCAEQFSNEPASITRRAQYTATIKVKEKFATNGMLNYDLVKSFYGEDIPLIPDLWDITVEKSFPVPNSTPGKPDLVGFEVVNYHDSEFGSIRMENVGIEWLILFTNQLSEKYFKQQKDYVAKSNNLAKQLCFCSKCRLPASMCRCTKIEYTQEESDSDDESTVFRDHLGFEDESVVSDGSYNQDDWETVHDSDNEDSESGDSDAEEQSGEYMCRTFLHYFRANLSSYGSKFDTYLLYLEKGVTDLALSRLDWLMHSPFACWTNYIPDGWMDNDILKQFILAYNEKELRYRIISIYGASIIMTILAAFIFCAGHFYTSCFLLFLAAYISYNVIESEKARIFASVKRDNESMPDIFKKYRDAYISYICGASLVISILYIIVQAWKFSRWVTVEEQGNLVPTCVEDIQLRDEEAIIEEEIKTEHNWHNVEITPIECNEVSNTTTEEQLEEKIWKNLAFMEYMHKGKKFACDIFFVCSNVALMPKHFWVGDNMKVQILSKSRNVVGPNFSCILSKAHSVTVEGHDLSLVWVPNGGCKINLVDYFPLDKIRNCPGKLLYKKLVNDDEIKQVTSLAKLNFTRVGNSAEHFYGASYSLEFNTFVGLCMGVLYTRTKQRVLAGFHLGGFTGRPEGICGTPLYHEIKTAIDKLTEKDGVVLSTNASNIPKEMYGKQILENQAIHPKSPMCTLPEDAHIEIYGSCPGRAKYISTVKESIIAKTVTEVCGEENKFGPPKFHLGKAWKESIDVSSRPSIGVEGDLLSTAVADYRDHLIEKIEEIPELKQHIRPLTKMETICGIDGVRFIDKMPTNTSVGAPLSGAKSKYISLLDPEEFPDFACPAELDQQFWDHFEQCKKEFLEGRRVYFPFKACLKDEPTPINKDKVRVFQAAPIVLQLFVRMYFLPIVRLLSLFPLDSECGVGINTVGPEFDALAEYMRKFGVDRILAGDYSKYDLRMPAQLIFAAFSILIDIAIYFGYDEESIIIMRAVATEIAYPFMMYNGDLVQHIGSNPSGQNLTVYINSIVNSLLMRCCFFSIYKNVAFRDAAAMMTYGDDVKGSVSKKYDEFNHLSYTKWLAEHDIVFTMPDKTSTPTKYMNDKDADFLKRSNVYNEDLEMWQGALSEQSIFKSLFANLESKVLTPRELAAQNIDGALREWWFHGRDVYEKRRVQMQQVANRHQMNVDCNLLNKDYDWMLTSYCDRYRIPYPDVLSRNDV